MTTCKEEKVKTLMILGDLTDAKDKHSAILVNRVVANIKRVAAVVTDVKILVGNHDWQQAGHEFFKFLDVIDNVQYISQPSEDQDVNGPSAYYLPYSKNPARDWAGLDFSHYQYLFMHQTIAGAVSSNGQEMEGEELPALNAAKVYSGDIHVPQVIKGVEYVGSPYHVHFGDAFLPRAVLLERGGRPIDLHFKTISRVALTVSGLRELKRTKLRAGDQIKLNFELGEADKHDWSKIKREASTWLADAGIEVHGLKLTVAKPTRRLLAASNEASPAYSPSEAVQRFVDAEELGGEALDAAMEVLEA